MRGHVRAYALAACMAVATTTHAGDGYTMKCGAGDVSKAAESCGYSTSITFGGGMFFEQLTGYCRGCKAFVYLRWSRPNIPESMKARVPDMPRPKPLGEVWDAATGRVMALYACPTCSGPFLEIKRIEELKHCPACNRPHFGIDPTAPRLAID